MHVCLFVASYWEILKLCAKLGPFSTLLETACSYRVRMKEIYILVRKLGPERSNTLGEEEEG